MGGSVNMLDRDGNRVVVDEKDVAGAIAGGYHTESADEQSSRNVSNVRHDVYGGIGGKVVAAGAGLLRGATLGGSDVVLGGLGGSEDLQALREENPNVSLGAEIVGGLSPVGPAGYLSKAGRAVAGAGEGGGIVARAAYSAGGAALEGAGQSGGAYLSSVALEDKPLSAEGFVGAMGGGALFAGGLGAGLSLAESSLLRAKALFPRSEVTREAAQQVEREATGAMQSMATEGQAMQSAAKQRLEQLRIEQAETRLAVDKRIGEAQAIKAEAQAQRSQALAERAKNPPARTRKAFDEPATPGEAPPAAVPIATSSPGTSATPEAADDLLSQLQGTKTQLDQGKTISEIAANRPDVARLADAQAAHAEALSEYERWLAKYGKGGQVEKFERSQAARDYAEGMRPKESGYYSSVPAGEGNAALPRGRQYTFRGSEAERAAADAEILAKVSPEERLAADAAVAESAARRRGGSIGEQVIESAAQAVAPEEHIANALRPKVGEHVDLGPDLAEGARVIGKVESTAADLAEQLGADAPATAAERAKAYREAAAVKADADAGAAARAADDVATKLVPEVARKTGGEGVGDIASKLGDLGAGMEVLKAMGIAVPDVGNIPVIGPVLSMYLKARAALGVFRRAGGSLPKTAETTIAAKKAATQNRMNAAMQSILDKGAKVANASQKAAGPLAPLGVKLFPGGDDTKAKEPVAQYRARMDELARAAQPNAVMQAVRDHVNTSDPALQNEIAAALQRKLGFLQSKAPRQTMLPTLLKGDADWQPSKAQLNSWAKYIRAADDPASVLEDVARGNAVSIEAAETLRTVYPSLYREAQRQLVERAATMEQTLPYTRRVSLSVLFQVPVDGTMSRQHIAFLQQTAQAAAPSSPVQGPPAGAPPNPTISGQVGLGDRTMTALDRRAGA